MTPVGQANGHVYGYDGNRAVRLSLGNQCLDVCGEIGTADAIFYSDRDPTASARIDAQHPTAAHGARIAHPATSRHTNSLDRRCVASA